MIFKRENCRAVSWLVSVALVVVCSSSQASDVKRAREHFERGLALSSDEVKDYEGALVEFEASAALYPTKSGLFNLAICYKRVGRYGEALDTFARLEEEFGADFDEELRAAVDSEREAIEQIAANLKIEVDQPGAAIKLDGDAVGTSPLDKTLVLGPGKHEISVALDRYELAERKLELASGQRHTERIVLKPLPAQLMVETGVVSGAEVSVDGKVVGTTPLDEPLQLDPGSYKIKVIKNGYETPGIKEVDLGPGQEIELSFTMKREIVAEPITEPHPDDEPEKEDPKPSPLFWTGVGLTGAAAIASGVFLGLAFSAEKDFDKYNDQIATTPPNSPSLDQLLANRDDAKKDVMRFGKTGLGLGIGAGALAVASVVILAIDLKGDEDDSLGVDISAAPGGLVVAF